MLYKEMIDFYTDAQTILVNTKWRVKNEDCWNRITQDFSKKKNSE